MTSDNKDPAQIEVYEWKPGAARPGAQRRPSDHCIDILEIPSNGQIPQVGDVLMLPVHADTDQGIWGLEPYVVVEREFLWRQRPTDTDGQTPLGWSKMWIHVRRLTDYSLPATEVSNRLEN